MAGGDKQDGFYDHKRRLGKKKEQKKNLRQKGSRKCPLA